MHFHRAMLLAFLLASIVTGDHDKKTPQKYSEREDLLSFSHDNLSWRSVSVTREVQERKEDSF